MTQIVSVLQAYQRADRVEGAKRVVIATTDFRLEFLNAKSSVRLIHHRPSMDSTKLVLTNRKQNQSIYCQIDDDHDDRDDHDEGSSFIEKRFCRTLEDRIGNDSVCP